MTIPYIFRPPILWAIQQSESKLPCNIFSRCDIYNKKLSKEYESCLRHKHIRKVNIFEPITDGCDKCGWTSGCDPYEPDSIENPVIKFIISDWDNYCRRVKEQKSMYILSGDEAADDFCKATELRLLPLDGKSVNEKYFTERALLPKESSGCIYLFSKSEQVLSRTKQAIFLWHFTEECNAILECNSMGRIYVVSTVRYSNNNIEETLNKEGAERLLFDISTVVTAMEWHDSFHAFAEEIKPGQTVMPFGASRIINRLPESILVYR